MIGENYTRFGIVEDQYVVPYSAIDLGVERANAIGQCVGLLGLF